MSFARINSKFLHTSAHARSICLLVYVWPHADAPSAPRHERIYLVITIRTAADTVEEDDCIIGARRQAVDEGVGNANACRDVLISSRSNNASAKGVIDQRSI